MTGLEQALKTIKNARSIAVIGHINPDGDSIGSLLSLGLGLKKLRKKVYMISPDGVPKRYIKLPGAGQIARELGNKVDLAVTVDCSSMEMLGPCAGILGRAKQVLEIDHHEIRESFGDISYIDPKAAAMGEMVYIMLNRLKVTITPDIGANIVTSLIVETNSFRLPNISPFTFKICSDMVAKGVDFYKIVDMVFWSRSKETAVLIGLSLSRCKFRRNGRIAWTYVNTKDFSRVKGKDEDVDSVADEIRAIRGVEIAIFFREKNEKTIRVSLRSKKSVNIAKLAKAYGGGGHYNVAGCFLPNSGKARRDFLLGAEKLLK